MNKKPYTIFKCISGTITTENTDRLHGRRMNQFRGLLAPMGEYDSWDIIHETWEDEEIIKQRSEEMLMLIKSEFKISCVELSVDNGWNISTEPYNTCPPYFNIIGQDMCNSPTSTVFSMWIIGDDIGTVNKAKELIKEYAIDRMYKLQRESIECIKWLIT